MYINHLNIKHIEPNSLKEEIRFIDAISQGLRQSMQRHKDLVLMGQDIAEYGGVFKITEGFVEEFGNDRVRNTPICESAIVEAAMGLSIAGMKSVVEMQFADFVSFWFQSHCQLFGKIILQMERESRCGGQNALWCGCRGWPIPFTDQRGVVYKNTRIESGISCISI